MKNFYKTDWEKGRLRDKGTFEVGFKDEFLILGCSLSVSIQQGKLHYSKSICQAVTSISGIRISGRSNDLLNNFVFT